MSELEKADVGNQHISRRKFIVGGAAVAGTTLALGCSKQSPEPQDDVTATAAPEPPVTEGLKIEMQYRTLGRTGFKASDISMGCGRINEPNVIRYAYDHGVNYFDTAWIYGNGDSETKIGEAMQFMERQKIFITTKLPVEAETTEQELRDRLAQSLERLHTDYVDGLLMHGIADVSLLDHEAFRKVGAEWKADGKVKHLGVSSHGPRGDEPDSMERVLVATAEDPRFDLILIAYNFMNKVEGENVLEVCREKQVGVTGMKMAPGVLEIEGQACPPYLLPFPIGIHFEFVDTRHHIKTDTVLPVIINYI